MIWCRKQGATHSTLVENLINGILMGIVNNNISCYPLYRFSSNEAIWRSFEYEPLTQYKSTILLAFTEFDFVI